MKYILLFFAVVLLLSCSKDTTVADSGERTVTVSMQKGPGINQLNNPDNCWKIVLIFDKPVSGSVSATVNWHCNAVVGAGSVYYSRTFTVAANGNGASYTTNIQAHDSYQADQVQLVSISCDQYTFL